MSIPRDTRAARYTLERHRDYVRHLELARSAALQTGVDCADLNRLLDQSLILENRLKQLAEGPLNSRKKHKKKVRYEGAPIPRYHLFLDECGTHAVRPPDPNFPAFALCGIVISDDDFHEIDVKWKNWKITTMGVDGSRIHEPDIRKYRNRFKRTTKIEREAIDESLAEILSVLNFHCIAAVVDLHEFGHQHPSGRVDDYLPQSCYLMAIDFVMERFVHFLREVGDSGKGHITAESRETKEDVLVNYEYVRLQKEGTQFVSESDFRWYLSPHINFLRKDANSTGLQIADIAARPLAEKVLDPTSTPKRWDVISSKLYDGAQGRPESYGLKVFPLTESNDPFIDTRQKKKEMQFASPSSD